MLKRYSRLAPTAILLSALILRSNAAPSKVLNIFDTNSYRSQYPDIMPISEVRPGMVGYGLTVFRGSKIEKFGVTVVGVVKKGSLAAPGHDMILVKMSGGPMTNRGAFIIHGMSGSPVYINGKIIGAFSQGEPNSKEPLGGVTPIEDMFDAWDPKLPSANAEVPQNGDQVTYRAETPLHVNGRTINTVLANVLPNARVNSRPGQVVLTPCTTFASFTCASHSVREKLAAALKPYNVELVQGISGQSDPNFKGAPIVPGAAFGLMLVSGDLTMGSFGTVTYRKGDMILGFGHPFMGIGPLDAALCSAWVYDVYPLTSASYKICGPGPIVGASTQDRLFSVGGALNRVSRTIPVTVDVRDRTTGRAKVFHAQVAQHPNLFATLVSTVAGASVSEIRSFPGPAMAKVTTTVDVEGIGKITRTNTCYDGRSIDAAAIADLDDALSTMTSNPFYPLKLNSSEIKIEVWSGRQTAQIEKISVDENKFEAGDTVKLALSIKPFKSRAIQRIVNFPLPQNMPAGRYTLQVKGGYVGAPVSFGGLILRSGSAGGDQLPPVNIRQMFNRYMERETNTDAVVRLVLPTTSVNFEGEKLPGLPSYMDSYLRTPKSSGVRLERDDVRLNVATDYVLSGQQLLTIQVVRKAGVDAAISGQTSTGSTQTPSSNINAPPPFGDTELASISPIKRSDVFVDDRTQLPILMQKGGVSKGAKTPTTNAVANDSVATHSADSKTVTSNETNNSDVVAPQPSNDKPIARFPLVWKQSAKSDMSKGILSNVSVSTNGFMSSSETLQKIASLIDSTVQALALGPDHSVFAATGPNARILNISSSGEQKELAVLPEQIILCLLSDGKGGVFAGTGPHGALYHVKSNGQFSVVFRADEKYVLSLFSDPANADNLFVGTGGGSSKIYLVKGNKVQSLATLLSEQILSITSSYQPGHVVVATGNPGTIVDVAPDGKRKTLYDAGDSAINSIINDKSGLVFSTSPRSSLLRLTSDGSVTTLYDKSAGAIFGIARPTQVNSSSSVFSRGFAISGNQVISISEDGIVKPVFSQREEDFSAIATGEQTTWFASSNPATLYTLSKNAAKSASYTSVVRDCKSMSQWGVLRLNANVPSGANLVISTRTGSVPETDSSWSSWQQTATEVDGERILSPSARFIQYRIQFLPNERNEYAGLRDISLEYLPSNSAPKVSITSPSANERWSGKQTFRWEASDPDKDTLSFDIWYSTDNGVVWTKLPGQAAAKTTTTNAVANRGELAPLGSGPPTVEAVMAELSKHPDIPEALRNSVIERTRKVRADFEASPAGQGSVTSTVSSSVIRETSKQFDTSLLGDGKYIFKVIASDQPSNPTGYLTSESISEPVIICNSVPVIIANVGKAGNSYMIEGVAVQKMVSISAMQYRIDSGDWTAISSANGFFGRALESFKFPLNVSLGVHTVDIKVFNSSGGSSVERLTIESR